MPRLGSGDRCITPEGERHRGERVRKIPKMGIAAGNLTFWSTVAMSNSYSAYMIGYGRLAMRVHRTRFPKAVTNGLSTASKGESGNRFIPGG